MRTHAAFSSLLLSAVLATSPSFGQALVAPAEIATDVAVRMQARVIEARNRLADARTAEARRETLAASQHYNRALDLVQGIGVSADAVRQEAIEGLSRTTLQLADQAIKRGDYAQAKLQIDRVIKVDPGNKLALEMRARNDRLTAETYDKTPHDIAKETLAATETNRVEINKLVQDGKLYYETGRLKEAEEVLRLAVKMDPDNRSAAYYLSLLYARKHAAEARLREVNSKQMLLEVESEWTEPVTRTALQVPNMAARTNLVYTSNERQTIYNKLRRIRLNEWGPIDNLPLSEVIRSLNDEARRRDVETNTTPVNLFISPNADSAGGPPGGLPAVDASGLPIAAPEPTDLNGVLIRLGTQLRDLTLEQILNILTTIADRKIKFSVEDYGVIISPKATEPVPLHTRFFKLDPNTFQQGLQNVAAFSFGESQSGAGGGGGGGRGGGRGGGGGGRGGRGGGGGGFGGGGGVGGGSGDQGSGGGAFYGQVTIAPLGGQQGQRRTLGAGGQPGQPGAAGPGGQQQGQGGISFLTEVTPSEVVIPTVKSFFLTAGVNLNDPGKAVFFNDRLGVLMVRATLQDLDTIEKAIQMLNMSPPQLTIRAKFMEVTQDDSRALGFDWYLGNTLINDGRIGAQGGTAPSMQGPDSAANPSGWFPGPSVPGSPIPGPGGIPASPTDNLITGGLRNTAPSVATVTGILTDPQFRFVVRALEQRGGTDLLSAPEVTTMSGRQAQIKVVDIRYIVTDLDADQTAAGTATTALGATGGGGGIGSLIVPLAEPFEIGPVLDVVPYVNADGYTIQLTILPTLKEFLGYDDPGAFVAQVQSVGASGPAAEQALTQPTPLPRFRLRQVATTAMVWDGQTVVLGGLIAENVQKTKDKVPVLGDLPFLGRFFRSEANIANKKNLVIFVTPTLIDPAGNRLHSDEEMPFAQQSIPAQPRLPIQ
jgi:type II secretory pathway component GspD/PulD (secretin)/tetratricopeptide (TPR) repeat protein